MLKGWELFLLTYHPPEAELSRQKLWETFKQDQTKEQNVKVLNSSGDHLENTGLLLKQPLCQCVALQCLHLLKKVMLSALKNIFFLKYQNKLP